MNREDHRCIVNGELFICSNRLLTPDVVSHVNPRKVMGSLLVAFVLVGTPKMINCDKLSQGIPEVVDAINVYAKIQNAIKSVTVIAAR